MGRRGASLRLMLPLALVLAGCDGGADAETVRVLAAASLTDVLPRIVERYREAHPDARFELQFAGSQTLATQIGEGAPAAVFISANPEQVERLLRAGLAARPRSIAENRLVLAVRDEAPWQSVQEVAAAEGLRLALGAPGVPVGELTRTALETLDPTVADRLRAAVVTEDPTVRVVLSRVELGEADAAFVYHTDIIAVPALRAIALPEDVPRNEYVAALVTGRAGDPGDEAASFLEYLTGPEAQAALAEAGFLVGASSGNGRAP